MLGKISIPSITVNGVIVPVPKEPVGNMGAVFHPKMNMSADVSQVIRFLSTWRTSVELHLLDI